MSTPSLAFGFGGRSIIIECRHPEVLDALQNRMGRMAANANWKPVAHLRVERDAAGYRLEGEPDGGGTLTEIIKRLELEILDATVNAHGDLIWFHSGAAARQGRAVLIAGQTGSGKSTLVLDLCRRGWQFIADDMVPLERESHRVHPLLRTPVRRVNPGVNLPAERVQELRRIQADWSTLEVCPDYPTLGALIFPVFDAHAELHFEPLPASAAVMGLAGCCLSFVSQPSSVLPELARLAQGIPAWRVHYADGHAAGERIDAMWPELISPPDD